MSTRTHRPPTGRRYHVRDLINGLTLVHDRHTDLTYLFHGDGSQRSGPRARFNLDEVRTQCP